MDEVGYHHNHHDDDDDDIGEPADVYAPYLSPGEKSLLLQYRMSRRHHHTADSLSTLSSPGTRYNSEHAPNEPSTPPLLSSPSAASLASSSHGVLASSAAAALMSPGRRKDGPGGGGGLLQSALPLDAPGFPPSQGRAALARRLGLLAQQLTTSVDVDELALTTQLDLLERSLSHSPARIREHHHHSPLATSKPHTPARTAHRHSLASLPHHFSSPAYHHTPAHLHLQHRPARLGARSHSDIVDMLPTSSPAPSLHRSRYSDLSASMLARLSEINAAELFGEPEMREEPEPEPEPPVEKKKKGGMSAEQAEKVIVEAAKLNNELSTVVENLKARLEESDHIHTLLIERAERAAQRIIFLQNRISYLEEELQENDDELQHFRICLKAVEIQLPPHPDNEIQRCISTFKEDYRALKQKRVSRSSIASYSSLDNTQS